MENIYENDYARYWDNEYREARLCIYEMNKGLPSQYHVGKNAYVQQRLDGKWGGYTDGALIAHGDNCNRVMIRTHNKSKKRNIQCKLQ